MKQVTFANLKAHKSRLVAVSLAVILAVAFMSATLLLGSSTTATLGNTLGAELRKADAVITPATAGGGWVLFDEAALESVQALDSVKLAVVNRTTGVSINAAKRNAPFAELRQVLHSDLEPAVLEAGRLPEAGNEIVLDAATMRLLELEIGESVKLAGYGADGALEVAMQIVGVSEQSKNPFYGATSLALVTEEGFSLASGLQFDEQGDIDESHGSQFDQIIVKIADGKNISDLQNDIANTSFTILEGADTDVPLVKTPDEIVAKQVSEFSSGSNVLLAVMLVFVGIALFVAGLVISNTFSVLVAGRSRELALLRTIGASNRQVKRSVMNEALVMALIASSIGVALAFGLMAGLIKIANVTDIAGGSAVFAFDWKAIAIPLIAGVIVTAIAASGPAREATRVSPLEAMRTAQTEKTARAAGLVRLSFGLLFFVAGIAIIVFALTMNEPDAALFVAFGGALVSAVGVLMLTVFVVPVVTHFLGRALFSKTVSGKIAALNSIRNKRRTATTASALLIGVTLVTTVYTGAQVARTTLANELAGSFPVDMAAVVSTYSETKISDNQFVKLQELDGVAEVVRGASVQVDSARVSESGASATDERHKLELYEVWGVEPADFARVTNDQAIVLRAGEVLTDHNLDYLKLKNPVVSLESGSRSLTLGAASVSGAPRYNAIVSASDFTELSADTAARVALIKTVSGLTPGELMALREDVASIVPESYVMGEGIERAMFEEVIQILLMIVTGLLAIAIVIAVIGIANTLSLSVIERTRENSLMRALGLTKSQLRAMLAAEAVLTALTAAFIGVVLGVGYGFAGAASVFGQLDGLTLDVPWLAIIVIALLAVVAGLLASVAPAGRATKVSPVEGLRSA